MNWITVGVIGAVAVWFEYSYRRSRHKKAESGGDESSTLPVSQTARVERLGSEPSIVPGDENDKQMNAAV
jgi:hypothetical protein